MPLAIKHVLENSNYISNTWKTDLLKKWPAIIGDLQVRITIEKIDENAIVIGVNDACWLQELHMLSSQLCRRINQHLDTPRIQKIYFRKINGAAKPYKKHHTCVRIPRNHTPIQLSSEHRASLSKIKDIELQEVLKKFYYSLLPG